MLTVECMEANAVNCIHITHTQSNEHAHTHTQHIEICLKALRCITTVTQTHKERMIMKQKSKIEQYKTRELATKQNHIMEPS